jgi:membrane protease YdiL (CAAX protease family)
VQDSSEGTTRGSLRFILFIFIVVVSTFVGVSVYTGIVPFSKTAIFRVALPAVLAIATLIFFLVKPLKKFWPYSFALLAVSTGFAVAWFYGNTFLTWFNVSVASPKGIAIAKLGEAIPIVAFIFLFNLLSGKDSDSLYLGRGNVKKSLLLGLIILPALIVMPFALPDNYKILIQSNGFKILSLLPWVFVFAFANCFMEEIWFRGIWLNRSVDLIGVNPSYIATIIIFSIFHFIIYIPTESLLFLILIGAVWTFLPALAGWITLKTRSLWGAVLAHFFIDAAAVLLVFIAM